VITVENLSKTFRVVRRAPGFRAAVGSFFRPQATLVTALDRVSFAIAPGEVVGYIGPNGAGKSSTVKVLSGILVPDSGRCLVGGRVPWKDRRAHVQDIGVVFGQRSQLWWDVPVEDSFELLRDIYRVPRPDYRERRDRLVLQLDLGGLLATPVRQLSLGQRMRCEVAAALLHRPKLLFLDEPTIGLDAPSKQAVRSFVRDLNREEGTTVLLTTHDMGDVEALADRILMIGHGRLLYDGDLEALRNRFGPEKTLTVDLARPSELPSIPGCRLVTSSPNRAVWTVDTARMPVSRVIANLSASVDIVDLTVEDPPVEDLVVRLYREFRV
jgi:ABC-2 type transport system ATP-binding protein